MLSSRFTEHSEDGEKRREGLEKVKARTKLTVKEENVRKTMCEEGGKVGRKVQHSSKKRPLKNDNWPCGLEFTVVLCWIFSTIEEEEKQLL